MPAKLSYSATEESARMAELIVFYGMLSALVLAGVGYSLYVYRRWRGVRCN